MPNPPTKEFPLRHAFAMDFTLQEFEASPANFATIIPLFFADQAKTEALAQAVQVNRANDNYDGIKNSPACFMNSRVNMIKITEYCMVPAANDIPDAMYHKAIITWGLGDHLIEDPSGVSLLTKLKFTKAADTIHPTWTNVNIEDGGWYHADVDGLTANQEAEAVSLRPDVIQDERDGSLGPKIRSMVIGPFLNRVHKDYPYYSSRWFQIPGRTKRMNAFTGCFLYVGLNAAKVNAPSAVSQNFSPHFEGDLTTDERSLAFHYLIEFNEYHDSFDISA